MRWVSWIAALLVLGVLTDAASAYDGAPWGNGCMPRLLLRATLHSRARAGQTMPADFTLTPGIANYCCAPLSLLRSSLGRLLPAEAMPANAPLPAGSLRQSGPLARAAGRGGEERD